MGRSWREDIRVELSEGMAEASGILEFATLEDLVNAIRLKIAGKSRFSYGSETSTMELVHLIFPHKSEFETLVNFRVTLERVGEDELSWEVVSIEPDTFRITMR